MGCTCSKSAAPSLVADDSKNIEERKAAWEEICAAIPRSKSTEDKELRMELFKKLDQNNDGKLSLEEVYAGCVNEMHLDKFTTRLHNILQRALKKAKSMGNTASGSEGSPNYVEYPEFRLMLCYIYNYFELTVMFDNVDTSGNGLINYKEFNDAVPMISSWGCITYETAAVWKELDRNNTGNVTFDELATWAVSHKLDADGDPDKTV
ncbi:hypothetical protein LSCM1_05730 [Leishmania martiniquensis]|uniref:EF-hand domain-containing protein n=1 Tax=Leishmania martiniquensis TaxID=1580590 RepID=A0A836KPH3_9TRYP|nr:hypothetical protein LSCM1_05730 [Leishmania martiniquensis]